MVHQRLEWIAELPPGWNGGKGIAPDRPTIGFAGQQLARLEQQGLPAPAITPSPDGAVYAEWHERGLDIELIFEAPGQVVVLAEDARGDLAPIEAEGPDIAIAQTALTLLGTR